MTVWTFFFRRPGSSEGVTTFAAPPIGEITFGADIPGELALGGIAAQGAFHGHLFVRGGHGYLLFSHIVVNKKLLNMLMLSARYC